MRFLRFIWRDVRWLNSQFSLPVKIAAVIFAFAFTLYVGPEWWNVPGRLPRSGRLAPGWEQGLVFLSIGFLIYFAHAIDRYRRSR
jgi:hypothetical protein